MNIHFNNANLLQELTQATLLKVEFGSSLYGINSVNSDVDYLYLHAREKSLDNSFLWEHHQLQMKHNNQDLIFSTLHLFLRNLLSGDSTINFEVLHSSELAQSSLNFLFTHRQKFYNYNMIKSYLGLAKRDLKSCLVNENQFVNFKKLSHAYRGIISAQAILNCNYDNQLTQYQADYQIIKDLKLNQTLSFAQAQELVQYLENLNSDLRKKNNNLLESKKINRTLDINFMKKLDEWLNDFTGTIDYTTKQNHLQLDKTIYYLVLEEGLKY